MYNYYFLYFDICVLIFFKKLFIYWELSCLKQREIIKNIKIYGIFFIKNKKLYKFILFVVFQIYFVSFDELYIKYMKRFSIFSI